MESSNIQEIINQDPTLNSIYNDKELLKKNVSNIEKFLIQHKGCNPDEVKAYFDSILGETEEVGSQDATNSDSDKQGLSNAVTYGNNDVIGSDENNIVNVNEVAEKEQVDYQQNDSKELNQSIAEGNGSQPDVIQQDVVISHENDVEGENSINAVADNATEANELLGYVNSQTNSAQPQFEQGVSQSTQQVEQQQMQQNQMNNFGQVQQQPIQQNQMNYFGQVQQEPMQQNQINGFGQMQQQVQQSQMNNFGQVQQQPMQQNQINGFGQVQQQVQQNQMNNFGQMQQPIQQNQMNNFGQVQQQPVQQNQFNNFGQVQQEPVQQVQYNSVQQYQQSDMQQAQQFNSQQNNFQQPFAGAGQGDAGTGLPEVKKESWLTKLLNKIFKKKSQ